MGRFTTRTKQERKQRFNKKKNFERDKKRKNRPNKKKKLRLNRKPSTY